MSEGTIATTFLIVFREALEASLIVGIILTALARLQETRYFPHVVGSSLAAIVASLLGGWALMSLTEGMQGRMEKLMEGTVSIVACGVLTYMIFWMDRQAKRIKSEIEARVEEVVSRREKFALMALPFLAVFREGAETVLYLDAVAARSSGSVSFWGGVSGLATAILVVCAVFIGGKRIPLRLLFRGSGLFLLLVAAGLLSYGIHEFQEIGLLPEIYAPVWNLNPILNEKEGIGAFLKSLFGYNGNPSLLEVIASGAYFLALSYFLFARKPVPVSAEISR